ncbi:AAA family ATPase [Bradyrhizobium sp. 31Argb]|uniref:AAA family ATPase n=1 Tax=Bradyrhizobium sp. 31Argb TaxID=3141247 RepID=UPI003748D5AB
MTDLTASNSVSALGPFAEGFASWRRMLAAVDDHTARTKIFTNAAAEVASYVAHGLDRVIAADTLTQLATAHGLDNVDQVQAIIAKAFAIKPRRKPPSPPQQPQPRTFALKAFKDIRMSTASSCLVRGILPRVGLVVVWGPPKCGKSFWVFDLTMHVALGWSYRGHRVLQGPVVYLALEGGHGFAKRVEAWRRYHLASETPTDAPFWLLDVPVDVIADRDRLVAAIRAQLGEKIPAVVVIDTLNRGLNGSENEPKDMARFIQAADIIREAFGCVVIIVHHCGIEGTRPRGHTSLAGAADAQIAVARDEDDTISVTVETMKDDEPSAPMACRLERVELGTDDEGELITSCIMVETDEAAAAKRPKKLTGMEKLALDQLRELSAELGVRSAASNHIPHNVRVVPKELWRKYFHNKHPSDDADTTRKAFVRAVAKLQELQLIGLWNDEAWLPDVPDKAGH